MKPLTDRPRSSSPAATGLRAESIATTWFALLEVAWRTGDAALALRATRRLEAMGIHVLRQRSSNPPKASQ